MSCAAHSDKVPSVWYSNLAPLISNDIAPNQSSETSKDKYYLPARTADMDKENRRFVRKLRKLALKKVGICRERGQERHIGTNEYMKN